MTKIAIALFGEEVSPRFGGSTRFLLSEGESDGARAADVQEAPTGLPDGIPGWLASLGVRTVICGGIPRRDQFALEARGIEVIWGVIGPAQDALEAYRRGTLERDQFVWGGGRRGRGGGGGRRRRRRCRRPEELRRRDPVGRDPGKPRPEKRDPRGG